MSRRVLIMLPLMVVVGACGQRGDLYFPAEEREALLSVPAQPQTPPQPGATDDDPDDTPAPQGTTGNQNPDNAGQ